MVTVRLADPSETKVLLDNAQYAELVK
jgi:hypothetical protein